MLGIEHTASQAELERHSSRLLHSYAARCAARAELRDRLCEEDRARYEPGVFMAVPDGMLAMAPARGQWSLWLEWFNEYGRRLLIRGSREDVERHAIEVAVHGPAGGPDLRDQACAWRDLGGDGTLHWLALGGEFRLMPLFDDGGYILSFVRNDAPLRILGIGEAEELQRTAVERLERFRGDVVHAFLCNERIELRGVCAAGVLGYLEMHDGSRLLLGHLTGDRFGLFAVRGSTGRCVGIYDFEALKRGDLQEVLAWASPNLGDEDLEAYEDDGEEALTVHDAGQQPTPARRRGPQRPRATSPAHPRPATRSSSRVRAAPKRRPQPTPTTSGPSASTRQLLDTHLKPPRVLHGQGKSMVPKVFEALLGLIRQGLPDQLLRGCDLRRVIKAELGIEFHCCSKTFGQALVAVAGRTPLLTPVGKRWALPLGKVLRADPELLREIARRIEEAAQEDDIEASATTDPPVSAPPRAEPPAPDPQRAAATTRSSPAISTPRSTEPLVTYPQPAVNVPNPPTSEPGQTAPHAGEPAPAPETIDHLQDDTFFAVQDPRALLDLPWLMPRSDPQPLIRRDGHLRVTLASVPDSESASRRTGKKPRGPP